jgi:hypothetical protein
MSHSEDLQEFVKAAEDSPCLALETVKNQIAWFEYVNEDELTTGERERVLAACQRFFLSIRPLTRKYID